MEKEKKKKTPFKDTVEFEKEITDFLNKHKTRVREHAKRISDYFEMCCFNYVVTFYENSGFEVTVENLIEDKYRYKCSTQGNQSNFSFFKAKRQIGNDIEEFDIHHNLAVQSFHDSNIYTTPDIVVIAHNSVAIDEEFYTSKKKLSYVPNSDLKSFFEVKQFNPFPELLFNFIGTINELKNELLEEHKQNGEEFEISCHLAPSLMISGKSNTHTERIRKSLEERYNINVFYDLFGFGNSPFAKVNLKKLKKMKVKIEKKIPLIDEKDLPF